MCYFVLLFQFLKPVVKTFAPDSLYLIINDTSFCIKSGSGYIFTELENGVKLAVSISIELNLWLHPSDFERQ